MIETDVLLADLRVIANLKVGDPMPEMLGPVAWAETISKLCGKAANEIERLHKIEERYDNMLSNAEDRRWD